MEAEERKREGRGCRRRDLPSAARAGRAAAASGLVITSEVWTVVLRTRMTLEMQSETHVAPKPQRALRSSFSATMPAGAAALGAAGMRWSAYSPASVDGDR